MSDSAVVDVFVEDHAHEELLKPLVSRLAEEESVRIILRVRIARGGHGRAMEEFRLYQTMLKKKLVSDIPPDVLVVGIDGNCTTFSKKRDQVRKDTSSLPAYVVPACPDPHVERWYLADLDSFYTVVGHRPAVGKKKCARDHYKGLLARAVQKGGHPPTLGGIEFARELAASIDWYRAGKADKSFKAFVDELRGAFRTIRSAPSRS